MFHFERGLRPRNRVLGEVSEGAAEAPSDETKQMGPYHRSGYVAEWPPSRNTVWPVMKSEAGEARYTTIGPISSSRPVRRAGTSRSSRSRVLGSANASAFMSVTNQPGASALTWMLWRAHSAASARVKAMTPPLEAA